MLNGGKLKFLLIEDQEKFIDFLSPYLEEYGEVRVEKTIQGAKKALEDEIFDCAIIDMILGENTDGIKLIKLAKRKGINYIMALSNYANNQELVKKAYQNGANDFLPKSQLKKYTDQFIKKIVNKPKLRSKIEKISRTKYIFSDPSLKDDLYNLSNTYTPDLPIYIKGETGTGKTELAKVCIKPLLNLKGHFVNINCAGLSPEHLKSELFGHKKGAFTGAIEDKKGKVELADNGVLFLDEIGDVPLEVQAMLLKVLDEKEFTRMGCNVKRTSNFVLVTASLKPLKTLVENGQMREDFYNRIMGKIIYIKPLRERPTDLKLLIRHFLDNSARMVFFTDKAWEKLLSNSWNGNIRELKRVILNLTDKDDGIINPTDVQKIFDLMQVNDSGLAKTSESSFHSSLITDEFINEARNSTFSDAVKKLHEQFFDYALMRHHGNVKSIHDKFGVSRTTIYNFMKKKDYPEEILQ